MYAYRCRKCGTIINEDIYTDNKGLCDYCYYQKNDIVEKLHIV
jgi:DNA-directed RNA polymerase subunit RPC12/RpoP